MSSLAHVKYFSVRFGVLGRLRDFRLSAKFLEMYVLCCVSNVFVCLSMRKRKKKISDKFSVQLTHVSTVIKLWSCDVNCIYYVPPTTLHIQIISMFHHCCVLFTVSRLHIRHVSALLSFHNVIINGYTHTIYHVLPTTIWYLHGMCALWAPHILCLCHPTKSQAHFQRDDDHSLEREFRFFMQQKFISSYTHSTEVPRHRQTIKMKTKILWFSHKFNSNYYLLWHAFAHMPFPFKRTHVHSTHAHALS